MTKTNTKAFTLIELLIVIVIIGILAVALIPRLTGAQASARDAARLASVQQVATATAVSISEVPGTAPTSANLVSNEYLSSYPTDPKGETFGAVTITEAGSGYTVCSPVERSVKGNAAAETETGTAASGGFFCQYVR